MRTCLLAGVTLALLPPPVAAADVEPDGFLTPPVAAADVEAAGFLPVAAADVEAAGFLTPPVADVEPEVLGLFVPKSLYNRVSDTVMGLVVNGNRHEYRPLDTFFTEVTL